MRITENRLRKLIRQVLLERKSNHSQEISDLLSNFDPRKTKLSFGGGGGGGGNDDEGGGEGGGENEKEILKNALINIYLDKSEKKWSECSDNISNVILLPILKKIEDLSTFMEAVSSVNTELQRNSNVVVNLLGFDIDLENYSDKKSNEYKTLMRYIELVFILDVSDWLDIFESVCKSRDCREDVYNVSKLLNYKIKEIM